MSSKSIRLKWKSITGWHIIIPLLLIQIITSKALIDPVVTIRFTVFAVYMLLFSIALLFKKNEFNPYYKRLNNPIIYSYLVYCIISALSLTYTTNFSDGVFEILKTLLSFGLLILLLISIGDLKNFLEKVLKTVVILAVIIVGISFYQLFELWQSSGLTHKNLYYVKAVFAHKNILSEVLFLLFPFCIASIFYLKKLYKILSFVVSVFLLFFITILLTRAVWLALATALVSGVVFFLLFILPRQKLNLKNKFAIALGFILVIGIVSASVLMYSKTDSLDTFQKQTEKIINFNYGSTKDRIVLWKKTGEIIKENPIIGKGPASWKIEILKQGNTELRSEDLITFYQRPHNDFLWIWSESGLFALVAYLLIFIFAVFRSIKIARTTDIKNSILMMLMFMLLIGYIVFSAFSFPKERIEHNIFVTICLFIIIASNRSESVKSVRTGHKTKLIFVAIIVVSTFASIIGISRMFAENNLLKAFKARNNADWAEVVKYTSKAEGVFYKIDPFSTPISWYSGGAYFNMGYIDKAVKEYEKAAILNPYHIYVLNDLASNYSQLGKNQEAIDLYKQALKIAPHYQDALFNLAAVYYNVDSIDRAYATLIKIDSSVNSVRFHEFKEVITDKIAVALQNEVNESVVSMQIQNIRNSKLWMHSVFENSRQSNVSFRNRLLEEALYSLCDIDSVISIDEVNILKEKYLEQ
jgi:O-antigen ligase